MREKNDTITGAVKLSVASVLVVAIIAVCIYSSLNFEKVADKVVSKECVVVSKQIRGVCRPVLIVEPLMSETVSAVRVPNYIFNGVDTNDIVNVVYYYRNDFCLGMEVEVYHD